MSDQSVTSSSVYVRPEFENEIGAAGTGEVERRLSMFERISNIDPLRKFTILIIMVVIWELYARIGEINELMFPTFSATGTALIDALVNAGLLVNVWNSLKLLLSGYAIGISIAAVLVILATRPSSVSIAIATNIATAA